jgi:hypothetical protein
MSKSFYVKLSFFGSVVLEKIFEIFFYIKTVKTVSPVVTPPDPWGS